MEFYQKPESHQTQSSSSEPKTLEPTNEGKRPRKQSISSKSNGNNCPEIDIKQEIQSFDDEYVSKSRTTYRSFFLDWLSNFYTKTDKTIHVNPGKFMDNCWISCQVMADMKKVYDDLIIICI